MPFFFMDYWYIVLVLPMVILSTWAGIKVKTTFQKYSNIFSGLTGAEAAVRVLNANGVYDVKVERVAGNLTDHFDPRTNVIRLSESVYDSRTVAAVGVAAHEAGHAVQHAQSYRPIIIRNRFVPIVNFGSSISWIVIIAGLFMFNDLLIWLGIALFGLTTVFHLLTLPVELNASKRAMQAIRDNNLLFGDEIDGARKVLTAAAMTYIAALLTSIASLLRLIIIFGRRND